MELLHIYTGDGKGKTTAAVGLAIRAAGHGLRVLVAQFMKDGTSGEVSVLRSVPGVTVAELLPLRGFTFTMTPAELAQAKKEQAENVRRVIEMIREERPRLIVLDELSPAISCGLVSREDAELLVDEALRSGETCVTGRGAPAWLTERAAYVSRIEAVRHPYDADGIAAREGIEY